MAIEDIEIIAGYTLSDELPLIGVSLWNILLFLVVLVVGIIIVKIVAGSIRKGLLRQKVSKILAEFVARVIRIVLYVFVVGTALGFLGISMGAALVSVSVVLGFVLGFALGDTLSNISAGFMIAITKPFKKDDYVTVAGESGTVKSVGISVTELDTPDNKRVIIPNKSVWGSNIVNFSRHDTRRVDMEVGVSYTANLNQVIQATMEVLNADARVLKDPKPQISVKDMADSAVVFVVRPWCKTADYWDVFFAAKKALKEKYDQVGIGIPFPQMDVHLQKE